MWLKKKVKNPPPSFFFRIQPLIYILYINIYIYINTALVTLPLCLTSLVGWNEERGIDFLKGQVFSDDINPSELAQQ